MFEFYRLCQQVLSRSSLLQIYGLFNSILVNGIIGWGGHYETHLGLIQRLQKKLLKIIGFTETDNNRPLRIRQVFLLP